MSKKVKNSGSSKASVSTVRSSLKLTTNIDSCPVVNRDQGSPIITVPTPSPTNSNFIFPLTTGSIQNPNTKTSNTTTASNGGHRSVRRRFFNLLRLTRTRPAATALCNRQSSTHSSSVSKKKSFSSSKELKLSCAALSSPIHDQTSTTSSSAIIKDDLIESMGLSFNEHAIDMNVSSGNTIISEGNPVETCVLCYHDLPSNQFEQLALCSHKYCRSCMKSYLKLEITEGRVNLNCPSKDCPERIHPSDISRILQDTPELIGKYEQFMVRRVLQSISDTRWCPAPDCSFAVIASGYAACPEIQCLRPGCNTSFCYHCKATWHPNKTCDDAAKEKPSSRFRSGSFISLGSSHPKEEIKECPRCQASILKMDDGSCNHMTCPICEAEFCWLCGREISDLHYLSPSGCTFWGKKQWSRKKVILWQIATLIGAPVIIALVAGVAVPGVIIGVPVWAGRKIYKKFNRPGNSKIKRNLLVTLGVTGSIIASPIIAALAVGIGVPILLAYVYGVIPISLCRTGGCGVGTRDENGEHDNPTMDNLLPFSLRDVAITRTLLNDTQSIMTHPTIGGDTNSLSNSVVHLIDERGTESTKAIPSTGAVSLCESIPTSNRLEVQVEMSDCKSFDVESITISEKSSKTMDSLKALAGSIKDACTIPMGELSNESITNGLGDGHGPKLSVFSNTSDHFRAANIEHSESQQTTVNNGSSPYGDKTVSFYDEHVKIKGK